MATESGHSFRDVSMLLGVFVFACFFQATKPVQTALQSTFADRRVVIETARHLPEPLYLLFAQFQSYSETCRATPSFSLSVSIGGDIDAGKKTSKRIEEEQRAKCESANQLFIAAACRAWSIPYSPL